MKVVSSAPYHLRHASSIKFKINITLYFMFVYGFKNTKVIVIYSRFRYPKGNFCVLFKFSDDHIRK